jgi:hypothetical protein
MSQPAHKFRDGALQVAIWRNPGEKGNWYSVIPSRSYKKGDDAWKETDSLGSDDLLAMSKLLSQAHTWIVEAKKADAKSRKSSAKAAESSNGEESAQVAA